MASRLTFLHKLYHWTIRWAAHPRAQGALFCIAFIESSFFLIPPDVLLIPMVLAKPARWFRYAIITTLGSVLGGLFGYYIGMGLWETVGHSIVSFYHLEDSLATVRGQFQAHAFFTIFTAAFTPIPYKVITIASGLFQVSLGTFIIASILGRSLRFFIIAVLIGMFGETVKAFIERYFDVLSIAFVALLVSGFLVLQWLV